MIHLRTLYQYLAVEQSLPTTHVTTAMAHMQSATLGIYKENNIL